MSIAKFGVCSEKRSASDQAQYQNGQPHLQECDMLTQYTVEEQTITNVVDVFNYVITGVSTPACGEPFDIRQ